MKVIPFKKGLEEKVSELIVDAYNHFQYDFMGMMPDKLLEHNCRMFNAEHVLKKADSSEMFLCVSDDESSILGVACLEGDEVHTCYTRGDAQKSGVGRLLMEHIEGIAKRKRINKLCVSSNVYTEPFYEKCGYRLVKYGTYDFYGMSVKVAEMEKVLE